MRSMRLSISMPSCATQATPRKSCRVTTAEITCIPMMPVTPRRRTRFRWSYSRKKPQRVRHGDNAHSGAALLVSQLRVQRLHVGPMHARTVVMLGVIAVVEPQPVVQLVIRAHTPRQRNFWIAAEMQVVAVQIRKAVTEVVEGNEEADEPPVRDSGRDVQRKKQDDLEDAPDCQRAALAADRAVDRFRVVTKVRKKNVGPQIFRLTVAAVFVDRQRIARAAARVGQISVAFVMVFVDLLVKDLREADRHRLENAEASI